MFESGRPIAHVARLMRQEGIRGAKARDAVADHDRRSKAQKRPDLVKRDFTATAPDRLWVGDLTYLRTWEGRMYFAFLIDVFSRMIIGWQLAGHMRTDLVLDAVRMALGTRQHGADFRLVAHSDHGSTPRRTTRRRWTTTACWRSTAGPAMAMIC